MGFFGEIISDARLPVGSVSGSVRTGAESSEPAAVVNSPEAISAPTDAMPAVSHSPLQEAPVSLHEPIRTPVQYCAERRLESSTELLIHNDDSSAPGHVSDTARPLSRPEIASTAAPEQPQAENSEATTGMKTSLEHLPSQHGTRPASMVETEAAGQEIGTSGDFEDFTRLADSLHPGLPMVQAATQPQAETTQAMTEQTQVIQTPDSSMPEHSRSRSGQMASEHAISEQVAQGTGQAEPVAATMQQADQWLGRGRLDKPVAGSGPKKEERHQQPGVKIGRIDVVIEAPVQQAPAHVEQQTPSHGFSSRHYLRGV